MRGDFIIGGGIINAMKKNIFRLTTQSWNINTLIYIYRMKLVH